MRVTGGELGGRRLLAPPSGVRPTADRVREALFARLRDLDGACVLDMYAGTGALGIEALSREAEKPLFLVEQFKVVKKNAHGKPVLPIDEDYADVEMP